MRSLTSSCSVPLSFVAERFELGERLEILGPAGRPLHADEGLECRASAGEAEQRHLVGGRQQVVIGAAPDHFAKQVDVPARRREREVQPAAQRVGVEGERQAGRRAAQIRL